MRESSGKFFAFLLLVLTVSLCPCFSASSAQKGEPVATQPAPVEQPPQKLGLRQGAMCEKVENLTPVRQAEVFSVSIGQVYCYTSFDPVPQPTMVYHRWYHRDELSTQTRLRLYPPKWATYSVIQLRETDKGPWRVEISDQNGHVFSVLRFSISD